MNAKEPIIKITFVLVPEQHKDGAWHEHGLISGLPGEDIRMFCIR